MYSLSPISNRVLHKPGMILEANFLFFRFLSVARMAPFFFVFVEIYVKRQKAFDGNAFKIGRSVLEFDDCAAADNFCAKAFDQFDCFPHCSARAQNVVNYNRWMDVAFARASTTAVSTSFS